MRTGAAGAGSPRIALRRCDEWAELWHRAFEALGPDVHADLRRRRAAVCRRDVLDAAARRVEPEALLRTAGVAGADAEHGAVAFKAQLLSTVPEMFQQ